MKNKTLKLNVLLAVTDQLAPYYKGLVKDYNTFFKNHQGAFLGVKKTYEAKGDSVDEPNKRSNVFVQTTVDEKFQWLIQASEKYFSALFSQEKTNASGDAVAELVVEGKSWGIYSSLELLRLKGMIESKQLEEMLVKIPVRSDSEDWKESDNEMYQDRKIYQSPIVTGVNITTTKEDYILDDPNLKKGVNYTPKIAQKTTVVELGDTTTQKFSGEWSQRERAYALQRRTILLTAITKALKECNEVEIVESDLTSKKIFGYLFGMQ